MRVDTAKTMDSLRATVHSVPENINTIKRAIDYSEVIIVNRVQMEGNIKLILPPRLILVVFPPIFPF